MARGCIDAQEVTFDSTIGMKEEKVQGSSTVEVIGLYASQTVQGREIMPLHQKEDGGRELVSEVLGEHAALLGERLQIQISDESFDLGHNLASPRALSVTSALAVERSTVRIPVSSTTWRPPTHTPLINPG